MSSYQTKKQKTRCYCLSGVPDPELSMSTVLSYRIGPNIGQLILMIGPKLVSVAAALEVPSYAIKQMP